MSASPTRREMLTALAATAGAAFASVQTPLIAAEGDAKKDDAGGRTFYELRTFKLKIGPMVKRLDEYYQNASIPALRRAGCGPIGAFKPLTETENPSLIVLIPHPSLESFVTLHEKLAADAEYRKAGEAFRALPPSDPPYVGQEIQLLRAFPHFPKLEPPEAKPRIFELRVYRSHSLSAAAKKIEMFDTAGEIDIFRRTGLTPVFFGQNLTGSTLPCLTYMLTFPDMATKEKSWKAFSGDAEWKKLKTTPGYTDAEIVVDIKDTLLAPTEYSQV